MTTNEIISRIIELEYRITCRVISDNSFRPTVDDEYHKDRKEIIRLRKKVKDIIFSKDTRI